MRPGLWQADQVKDREASAELPPGIQVGEYYWWAAPGGTLMTAPMEPGGPALERADAVWPEEPQQRAAADQARRQLRAGRSRAARAGPATATRAPDARAD